MKSIRTRLLQAFVIVITALLVASLGFFLLNLYVIRQYKTVSDTMIAEYRLVDNTSSLIAAFNRDAQSLGAGVDSSQWDTKIADSQANIKQLTQFLDSNITSTQSEADYTNLKNSVQALSNQINNSINKLKQKNISDFSGDLDTANKLYGFVNSNGTELIYSQLKYSSSIRDRIDTTYKYSEIFGGSALILVAAGVIIYVLRFSKRIVNPLTKLTTLAQKVAAGDMNIKMEADLLSNQDETGSLSHSFNVMILQLKEKIQEITAEKASVEKKVEERTAELKEEQTRLAASVNSLNIGFIMTDVHDKIVLMNPTAHGILSYELNDEGVSKQDETELHKNWTLNEIDKRLGESINLTATIQGILRKGQPAEFKTVNYNGRILYIFLAPIFIKDEHDQRHLGSVILIQDITEEKVLERSKDEFFSIASHELRTPLTAIRGNTSMMQQYFPEITKNPDLEGMVGDIYESSTRLIDIVNDFLDLSRLEQGKMTFKTEEFALEPIVESVVYEMKTVLGSKNLHLKFDRMTLDSLPKVVGDTDRVKQVIYNLVGNANKFTEKGGIDISSQVIDGFVKVLVSDTGRGISVEGQKLLFHKFQQAGSSLLTRDTTRGTGLGLYISKMMIEKMGGKIALEHSEEGKGSTFSFTLPIASSTPKNIAGQAVRINITTGLSV